MLPKLRIPPTVQINRGDLVSGGPARTAARVLEVRLHNICVGRPDSPGITDRGGNNMMIGSFTKALK